MPVKHHTEETKRILSLKLSGEKNPMYGKRGPLSPNFGKKRSEKTKRKMSDAMKGKNLGNRHTEETKRKMSESRTGENNSMFGRIGYMAGFYGKHHSTETRELMSKNQMGEKNSFWNDGKSFEPYPTSFNEKLKSEIKNRDNNICVLCGAKNLSVHHIDYNKNNSNSGNLISLCHSCHTKTNVNREQWESFFTNFMEKTK